MTLERLSDGLIHLPRTSKRLLALGLDAGLCAITVWLAWCLRLEQWVPLQAIHAWTALGSCLLGLPVFWYFGLYASIFRHSGWNAMQALGKAIAVYGALFAGVVTLISIPGIPRSVGIIQPRRTDASPTILIVWSTSCAGCGEPLQVRTSLRFEWPNRRCTGCKAPGTGCSHASRRTSSAAGSTEK